MGYANQMITLFTEDVIDSCHRLRGYHGKCSRRHGHTWLIQIWVQGVHDQKDKDGILFDFGNIKKLKDCLDHRDMNEDVNWFAEENPTAENIAAKVLNYLLDSYPDLEFRVRIYETAVKKETYCQVQTDNFQIGFM